MTVIWWELANFFPWKVFIFILIVFLFFFIRTFKVKITIFFRTFWFVSKILPAHAESTRKQLDWVNVEHIYPNAEPKLIRVCTRCIQIKLKNVNKKRMATAKRLIFWNFSRHPLLIWLYCCFHHYITLKAVATATGALVLLTPANFNHFQRRKFYFQPLSFTFETFSKNLQKQKSLLGSMWRKSKQKK